MRATECTFQNDLIACGCGSTWLRKDGFAVAQPTRPGCDRGQITKIAIFSTSFLEANPPSPYNITFRNRFRWNQMRATKHLFFPRMFPQVSKWCGGRSRAPTPTQKKVGGAGGGGGGRLGRVAGSGRGPPARRH